MIYFAAGQEGMGGGIMVTASHNPADYNGLKMVKEGSRPISSDTGLGAIEQQTIALMQSVSEPSSYNFNPPYIQNKAYYRLMWLSYWH
jgi:phosphomannomutase